MTRAPTPRGLAAHQIPHPPQLGRALSWSALLARVYGFDALACPRAGCDGRLRVVCAITKNTVIRRILDHLGLPAELPRFAHARAPPDASPEL